MSTEQITLYTTKACPYAHRVELALAEVGVPFTRFEIDLDNKPEWYAPKVNPAGKVPSLTYGGPKVPADQPSPHSVKLAESLAILEFIGNLFPTSSTLLPASPVTRAKAHFFIEIFDSKYVGAYGAFQARGAEHSEDQILHAIDTIIELKLKEGGKYAVSNDFTIADAAVLPFLARQDLLFSQDIGKYEAGRGKKLQQMLQTEEKYAAFREYFTLLKERESFKKTFWPEVTLVTTKKRWGRI